MKIARLAALILLFASLTAFAAPNDDGAVIQHCGHPANESRGLSPTTNEYQLDLSYPGDVVYHFRPVNGGWTFVSAWMKHSPLSRERAIERFPCLREALLESESEVSNTVDPTLAAQEHNGTYLAETGSAVPFRWVIITLATVIVGVLMFYPARRRRIKRELPPPRSPQRKPEIVLEEERKSSGKYPAQR